VASRGPAPDKHSVVFVVGLHADAVTENGAAAEWTRGVHAQDADALPTLPKFANQFVDERALAGARRARHADEIGAARVGEDSADEFGAFWSLVLDQRNGSRDCAMVAGQQPF
jgi:hypothetical protein